MGLATTIRDRDEQITRQLSLVDEDDESAANDDTATSMTRGVGTFLYRAPEVAQHRAYDSGADMYSLGVVAFELLRGAPYATAMERVEHIQALRKAGERQRSDTVDCFDGDADGRVRELVLGLVRADPTQRPSAADLLNGPLLPAPRELSTEVLDAATSALRNPLSPARATLLDALFDAPTSELVDVAYDQNERGAFSVAALRDSRAREAARRRVVDQLEKAGAAPLDAPLLRPKPPPRDDVDDGDEVVLVDARGTSVLLPRESTTSFARRVARSALSRRKARASFGTCKRYACAKVFAPTAAGPPQERLEIAYDCVSRAAPRPSFVGRPWLCVDAAARHQATRTWPSRSARRTRVWPRRSRACADGAAEDPRRAGCQGGILRGGAAGARAPPSLLDGPCPTSRSASKGVAEMLRAPSATS